MTEFAGSSGSTTSGPGMPGPGWYHGEGDPAGTVRYWNGSQWVGGPVLPESRPGPVPGMTFGRLISPTGRVNRATFLVAFSVTFGLAIVALVLEDALRLSTATGNGPLYTLVFLATVWPMVATSVKRFHDLGLSAGWIALVFVPLVGWFLGLVLLVVVPGNTYPNKHGEAPPPGFAL